MELGYDPIEGRKEYPAAVLQMYIFTESTEGEVARKAEETMDEIEHIMETSLVMYNEFRISTHRINMVSWNYREAEDG